MTITVNDVEEIGQVWKKIGNDIDGEEAGDLFGNTVSLSSDGSVVAVGAPYNDSIGNNSGHVRIYENNSGSWERVGDDIHGEWGDYLGSSIKTITALGKK